jgi:hypothetical protein
MVRGGGAGGAGAMAAGEPADDDGVDTAGDAMVAKRQMGAEKCRQHSTTSNRHPSIVDRTAAECKTVFEATKTGGQMEVCGKEEDGTEDLISSYVQYSTSLSDPLIMQATVAASSAA